MITVGAFEAKTHLSALLERVARGEGGVDHPSWQGGGAAGPAGAADRSDIDETIAKLKAARAGVTLGGLDWKALRDEGRR